MKAQSSMSFMLFVIASIIGIVLLILIIYPTYANILKEPVTPISISDFQIYNFQEYSASSCTFSFSLISNPNINFPLEDVKFATSTGLTINPDYSNLTATESLISNDSELYTFSSEDTPVNYGTNVCSFISTGIGSNNYINGIYRDINNKEIYQQLSTDFVVDSPSTNPSIINETNIVSVTSNNQYGYVTIENTQTGKGTYLSFGEYAYLPSGTYSVEYVNNSAPFMFLEWQTTGGVTIENVTLQAGAIMNVFNSGGIKADTFKSTSNIKSFDIFSNTTTQYVNKKVKVTSLLNSTGYYTFFANNLPISGCTNIQTINCTFTESIVGNYSVYVSFKNSSTYEKSNLVNVYFEELKYPLYIKFNPDNTSSGNKIEVDINGTTNTCLTNCNFSIINDTPISIIEINGTNYMSKGFIGTGTDSYTGNLNTFSFKMNSPVNETALFEYYQVYTIHLYNMQNVAAPNNFQQLINLNTSKYPGIVFNGNLANFEIKYENKTITSSWIEGQSGNNITIWTKLNSGIPADSEYNLSLYVFNSTNNKLNASGVNGIGEAPTLSSTYGKYDDGSKVFTIYGVFYNGFDNWTTLNDSGYTPVYVSGAKAIQMIDADGQSTELLPPNENSIPITSLIVEASFQQNEYNSSGQASDGSNMGLFGNLNSYQGISTDGYGGGNKVGSGAAYIQSEPVATSSTSLAVGEQGSGISNANSGPSYSSGYYYWYLSANTSSNKINGGYLQSTNSQFELNELGDISSVPSSQLATYSATGSFNYNTFTFGSGSGGGYMDQYVYWIIGRLYPPNGVMPTQTKVVTVPIYFDNAQSTATTTPFQQMLNLTLSDITGIKYNNSYANFYFEYGNNTIIPAWIESNNSGTLRIYLNLKNGIPASTTLKTYLVVSNKNMLNSSGTSGIGEAPQLSPSYAEYDDGGSVFIFYSDFKGTSLNTSKWTSYYSSPTFTVDDGITVNLNPSESSTSPPEIYTKNYENINGPLIVEFYGVVDTSGKTGADNQAALGVMNSSNDNSNLFGVGSFGDYGESHTGLVGYTSSGSSDPFFDSPTLGIPNSSSALYSLEIPDAFSSSTQVNAFVNYGDEASITEPFTSTSTTTLGFMSQSSGQTIGPIYYFRTRAYPPNGVMPTVTVN